MKEERGENGWEGERQQILREERKDREGEEDEECKEDKLFLGRD